jgi:predicted nucleic acid-binding Zn ribbon protein
MKKKDWSVVYARREARETQARHGRSLEEAEALWKQASRTAALCAECFEPLAAGATVTMERRRIGSGNRAYLLRVPVCVTCWLIDVQRRNEPELWHRWSRHLREQAETDRIERCRCEHCARPMRVYRAKPWTPVPRTARCCCEECQRAMLNARSRERRRVQHEPTRCEVCGASFVPTRADARACSNRCRQAAFRSRRGSASPV